jgi:hypothetical protein
MESEQDTTERIKEYNDRRIVMASLLFVDYKLVPEFSLVLSETFLNCGFGGGKDKGDPSRIRR